MGADIVIQSELRIDVLTTNERRLEMAGVLAGRRGFTLTELLVVVGIIVLLISIVVPNITSRLTRARMTTAEQQIGEIETALASYHADFGTYPGDVFPTEDINNDGVLDTGEDAGVDVNGDGTVDYATVANGRIDRGDGVVNIDDLEWALKTTAKNGPYMEDIPLDPWDNKYIYYAPLTRPTGTSATDDFLYLNLASITSEDSDTDGRLDGNKVARDGAYNEDSGIGQYATTNADVAAGFTSLWAGRDNGILDFGDDDNMNGTLEYYLITAASGTVELEYGNADVSPDGLARNRGYYIFSRGRDEVVQSFTGYEDIDGDSQLDAALDNDGVGTDPFPEDIDTDTTLDTGYEDTGNDGIPGTKDQSEDDGEEGANEGFSGPYSDLDPDGDTFDIGEDDINSWNPDRPWRDHASYGG